MGAILTTHTAQSDGVFHCPISVTSEPGCCRPHRQQSERRKEGIAEVAGEGDEGLLGGEIPGADDLVVVRARRGYGGQPGD